MTGCLESTREVQVLAEHVGRHERDAAFRDAEAAFEIRAGVFADDGAFLQHRAAVDDRALDAAVLADVDQDGRVDILGGADELGAAHSWLLSPKASFVTGAVMNVSGGGWMG